jgi:hypothetical protein
MWWFLRGKHWFSFGLFHRVYFHRLVLTFRKNISVYFSKVEKYCPKEFSSMFLDATLDGSPPPHLSDARILGKIVVALSCPLLLGRGWTILTSRELVWCYACSWDVRGELTFNSMAQNHTSFTLLTSRDLAWSSGRLTCQHASQISAVAHISWDVTYVSSALQTLPAVYRNGGNAYWKSAPTELFIWHQVTRL